jgi:hypothetical protein
MQTNIRFVLMINSGVNYFRTLLKSVMKVWKIKSLNNTTCRVRWRQHTNDTRTLFFAASALGQKKTFAVQKVMSALLPISTGNADARKEFLRIPPPGPFSR